MTRMRTRDLRFGDILVTLGVIAFAQGASLIAAGLSMREPVAVPVIPKTIAAQLEIPETPAIIAAAEAPSADPRWAPERAATSQLSNDGRNFLLETAARARSRWWQQIPSYVATHQENSPAAERHEQRPECARDGRQPAR